MSLIGKSLVPKVDLNPKPLAKTWLHYPLGHRVTQMELKIYIQTDKLCMVWAQKASLPPFPQCNVPGGFRFRHLWSQKSFFWRRSPENLIIIIWITSSLNYNYTEQDITVKSKWATLSKFSSLVKTIDFHLAPFSYDVILFRSFSSQLLW